MTIHVPVRPSADFERFLEELEREIELGESHYENAATSYKAVGEWLDREGSGLRQYRPRIYVQGSFRLGTAIKPIGDCEYDVDAVCELRDMSKSTHSQKSLKEMLGREIRAYAEYRRMAKDPTPRSRCWTLHYAEGTKFHLDVTPCVPNVTDALTLRRLRVRPVWLETAVSITDKHHPNYGLISDDWPRSNPKAYSEWFKERMGSVFLRRREAVARSTRAEVERIPIHRVRTPLQAAIKLLKRHRDMMFNGDIDDAPVSIIINTLSAQAYREEETIGLALSGILQRMEDGIGLVGVQWTILNPTDPGENFADRWNPSTKEPEPKKREAFMDWLAAARRDFVELARSTSRAEIAEVMARAVGNVPVQKILERSPAVSGGVLVNRVRQFGRSMLDRANHRRSPTWPVSTQGSVAISNATFTRSDFPPERIVSEGRVLEKRGSLRFEAETSVPLPYRVYWQIVNTGEQAERANGLRGRFELLEHGVLTKVEDTLYEGTHSIECFIVRNGRLAAHSGPFIVQIE